MMNPAAKRPVQDIEDIEDVLEDIEEGARKNKGIYFKWSLALFISFAIPWAIWTTDSCMRANYRQTALESLAESIREIMVQHKADMSVLHQRISSQNDVISALPPRDFRDRMTAVETGLTKNDEAHTRIITGQAKMEATQENMNKTLDEVRQDVKALSRK